MQTKLQIILNNDNIILMQGIQVFNKWTFKNTQLHHTEQTSQKSHSKYQYTKTFYSDSLFLSFSLSVLTILMQSEPQQIPIYFTMLDEFPTELVQAILQHINASNKRIQTLKSLCLICQAFSQSAMALLFETISILSLQSFERISNIPEEFWNHPKIFRISGLIQPMKLIPDDYPDGKKNDATHAHIWYISNLEENRLSIIDSAEFQSAFHWTLQKFP